MFSQLVNGLKEFTARLRGTDPLYATRIERCGTCHNELPARASCPRCGGRGLVRRRVRLR